MIRLKHVITGLGLILSLYSSTLPAATPWYEIEVIVFEPVEPPTTTEKWPLLFEPPVLDGAVELLPAGKVIGDELVPFQVLATEQLQLSGEAKRLVAGNRYRILLHTAWRQPLLENGPGTPVHLTNLPGIGLAGDNPGQLLNPPGAEPAAIPASPLINSIDGTITVLLTRYLHIRPNLVYTNPEVDLARQIIAQENNAPSVDRFVMKESRRVKLQELHYFDHPYFGMIARIVRFEPPAAANKPAL